MNLEELEALRDVTPKIRRRYVPSGQIINGKPCVEPFVQNALALFQGPDDGVFHDQAGQKWLTGWLKGEHVRRRIAND